MYMLNWSCCCSHSKQGVHIAVKGVTLKANTAADQVLICGELFGQRFRYSTLVCIDAVAARSTHVCGNGIMKIEWSLPMRRPHATWESGNMLAHHLAHFRYILQSAAVAHSLILLLVMLISHLLGTIRALQAFAALFKYHVSQAAFERTISSTPTGPLRLQSQLHRP